MQALGLSILLLTPGRLAAGVDRWTPLGPDGGGVTALAVAFGLLTVLQVVLGELVPKSLSLARAERVALLPGVERDLWLNGAISGATPNERQQRIQPNG